MPKHEMNDVELVKTWVLPPSATLGSSIRAKGILLELRARLPVASKKSLDIEQGELTLSMPASDKAEFHAAASVVASALKDIESLPVIPREIQDILSIKTSERHRWLKDGRLPSAGTRTVKLRGRARKITFHVFDPRVVEDLLDRGAVEEWREEDAAAASESRRRAAYKAKLTRSLKRGKIVKAEVVAAPDEAVRTELAGWEEFGRDGLLR
ncbi:hypothetical protein [Rhizobium laguerreae]|uniref:Uncharacterized protein n=1 Tax=Rhizobium laguerreae TaxID=1076926 RepID=A0A7Y2W8Y4_9HYPH|nr:hypothetical protein [Rhizobium laguerreae]NNH41971.1 hypothetical protein [Rhizobium laguerreae]NNH57184.1 hypothetical protein [Rhizobium laguerreae]NNH67911.1 hypothetical protein [Rhizobium laguerreae]